VAGLLAPGGTLVTYGAMSKESLKIPNGFLIFRDLVVRGFWLTRWLRDHPAHERDVVFGEVFRLAGEGLFRPRVAAEFPLARAAEAVALAAAGMPGGKVLLCLGA
jgi:trans-2-enoyl-CoA reductase